MSYPLVTRLEKRDYDRLVLLLIGHAMTPIRWLGLVAVARATGANARRPFAREHLRYDPGFPAVRMAANTPLRLALPLQGLSRAAWARAVALEALAENFVPKDERPPTPAQARRWGGQGRQESKRGRRRRKQLPVKILVPGSIVAAFRGARRGVRRELLDALRSEAKRRREARSAEPAPVEAAS